MPPAIYFSTMITNTALSGFICSRAKIFAVCFGLRLATVKGHPKSVPSLGVIPRKPEG